MRSFSLLCCVVAIVLSNFDVQGNSLAEIIYAPFTGEKNGQSPVILVPGLLGSRIDAKLDKPSTVQESCTKSTDDWYNLYLNPDLMTPSNIYCYIDNIKLYYNNETRETCNSPGVETRVPGFGDPRVVEQLDPTHESSKYFSKISEVLVKYGYVRNVSIRGAPYDFRKAPSEQQQWFYDLKRLVVETYRMNNRQRVTFIAHSMGVSMSMVFFRMQSNVWKQKYIARMISLAGSYGGTVKTVKTFAAGDGLEEFGLSATVLREEEITMPSLSFLLPFPVFWKPEDVLVKTKSRNYTQSQMNEFFDDLSYPTGWEMRKDNLRYINNFASPNVEIHCIYGSQIDTVEQLYYKDSNELNGTPEIIYGDGDGTVNERSLKGCMYWQGQQKQNITTLEIPKGEHNEILTNNQTLAYIVEVLCKKK